MGGGGGGGVFLLFLFFLPFFRLFVRVHLFVSFFVDCVFLPATVFFACNEFSLLVYVCFSVVCKPSLSLFFSYRSLSFFFNLGFV